WRWCRCRRGSPVNWSQRDVVHVSEAATGVLPDVDQGLGGIAWSHEVDLRGGIGCRVDGHDLVRQFGPPGIPKAQAQVSDLRTVAHLDLAAEAVGLARHDAGDVMRDAAAA